MWSEVDSEVNIGPGQKKLVGLILLIFAVMMVIQGVRELNSPAQSSSANSDQPGGIIPARLNIPTLHFETNLAEVSTSAALAARSGWLNSSAHPGATGEAVIFTQNLQQSTNLKAGDKLEVIGNNGKSLSFGVTSIERYSGPDVPLEANSSKSSGDKLVKLLNYEGGTSTGQWLVISARLING